MKVSFFVQLFTIVIMTTVLMPSLIASKVNQILVAPFIEELDIYYGGPTLAVLAIELEGKSAATRKAYLQRQKKNLTHRISLQNLADLTLEDTQWTALYKEQLVYISETKSLLLLLTDGSQVLVLEDLHNSHSDTQSEAQREGMGLMTMLQRQLAKTAQHTWAQLIQEKAKLFDFPVVLAQSHSLELTAEQINQLNNGYIVAILDEYATYGSGVNYLLQQVPNSEQLLIVGPIAKAISGLIVDYKFINLLLLSACTMSLLCIWLLPSWRSSRSLVSFIRIYRNKGYSAPMPVHKFSHLNRLHNTFNQMSDNINNLFGYNKLAIYYLSKHLNNPLHKMQHQLNTISKKPTLTLGEAEYTQFEDAIDAIRGISSELLLFSKVQRMTVLSDTYWVDLNDWLRKNFNTDSWHKQLQLKVANETNKALIQAPLLLNALEKIINILDPKKLGLSLSSNSIKATATQVIYSNIEIRMHVSTFDLNVKRQLEELIAFSTATFQHHMPALTEQLSTPASTKYFDKKAIQEEQLPLVFCANILRLHSASSKIINNMNSLTLIISLPLQGANNE